MGGEGKEQEETRGQEMDEKKMEKTVERAGKNRKGEAPQGLRVANEQRV